MPRNVEVKAKIANLEVLKQRASELCEKEAIVIEQFDTFFKTESGRLKLREFKVISYSMFFNFSLFRFKLKISCRMERVNSFSMIDLMKLVLKYLVIPKV